MTQAQKKQTFEQSLKQLEKIVTQVEEGKIGLEESIDQYEQGMKLIKTCGDILARAEKRIEVISEEAKFPADS